MRVITLLYHDIAPAAGPDASGFPGPGPAVYKLTGAQMAAHFDALDAAGFRPGRVTSLLDGDHGGDRPRQLITFDDGGISALAIADLLDARGWPGHFFITTNCIGAPAFLTATAIRELDARGHVIGSHSATHPPRMSALSSGALRREWGDSLAALADVLGREVAVASVPGGFTSRAVVEAAAAAGVRALFTSEPVAGESEGAGEQGGRGAGEQARACMVLGRYAITRGTAAGTAVALASTRLSGAQARQWVGWNVKKAAKAVGGERYLQLRQMLLRG